MLVLLPLEPALYPWSVLIFHDGLDGSSFVSFCPCQAFGFWFLIFWNSGWGISEET